MADVSQAGFLSDIFEFAVSQVFEQNVAASGAGDKQALSTAIVVIGEGGHYADSISHPHSSLLRDIDKSAVAIVLVKSIPAELIEEINVIVAISVVIAYGHAGPMIIKVGFEILSLFTR